jgi:hypothetical protein
LVDMLLNTVAHQSPKGIEWNNIHLDPLFPSNVLLRWSVVLVGWVGNCQAVIGHGSTATLVNGMSTPAAQVRRASSTLRRISLPLRSWSPKE